MRTVKIISTGGSGIGTKVIDQTTGAEIKGVQSLSISITGADEIVRADLRLVLVEAEVEGHPRYLVMHPGTGVLQPITKIVFDDGSEFDPGPPAPAGPRTVKGIDGQEMTVRDW